MLCLCATVNSAYYFAEAGRLAEEDFEPTGEQTLYNKYYTHYTICCTPECTVKHCALVSSARSSAYLSSIHDEKLGIGDSNSLAGVTSQRLLSRSLPYFFTASATAVCYTHVFALS
jgi:hypothetical protein